MTHRNNATGILLVSHGSPRAEANQGFAAMTERVAARLSGVEVLPTYFSIAQPDIPAQMAVLASRGVRRVIVMPFFLSAGQHVTVDIPALIDQCRQRFPELDIEMLPPLENDPALEDVLVERLGPLAGSSNDLPAEGAAIEERSYQIIERQLGKPQQADPGQRAVVRRVVHATADLSFARTLRFHSEAIGRGRAALAAGKPIICDVKMVQAGLTKVCNEVICAINQEDLAAVAREKGCTRAAAAFERLGTRLDGALVAIGNAPTALWKILEIARRGGPRPALVVGLPVGFVGARESKLALLESDLCYITNISPRGGSPVAAAAINALALLDGEE